jgi:hypothetical protein
VKGKGDGELRAGSGKGLKVRDEPWHDMTQPLCTFLPLLKGVNSITAIIDC